MDRREFLSAAAFGGYSLYVFAGDAPAETPAPSLEEIRRDLDRLAPAALEPGAAAHEPNMRLVELDCDVLVAGE